MKPGAQEFLAKIQQNQKHDAGFQQCNAQLAPHIAAAIGQRRNQDQQWHHCQVLKQQNADDLLAMGRMQFVALAEQGGDNCRRRHGQGAAEGNGCRPAQIAEIGGRQRE